MTSMYDQVKEAAKATKNPLVAYKLFREVLESFADNLNGVEKIMLGYRTSGLTADDAIDMVRMALKTFLHEFEETHKNFLKKQHNNS